MTADTDIYDKAVEILEVWRKLRPGKKFFGMSADEFAETIAAQWRGHARSWISWASRSARLSAGATKPTSSPGARCFA